MIDSKTLKEERREELFETLKGDDSIGWAVDIIDPRELSAKMLQRLVYIILFLQIWLMKVGLMGFFTLFSCCL